MPKLVGGASGRQRFWIAFHLWNSPNSTDGRMLEGTVVRGFGLRGVQNQYGRAARDTSEFWDTTRKVGAQGKAVDQIIVEYSKDAQGEPTPKNLLEWLGGKLPNSDTEPLLVKHPLWIDVLKDVSWIQFKDNLVKAARRRE